MLGMRRFPAEFQELCPANEQEEHILEVRMLQRLFWCDPPLRIVGQKPHHQINARIADKRELLAKLRRLRRGQRDRLG